MDPRDHDLYSWPAFRGVADTEPLPLEKQAQDDDRSAVDRVHGYMEKTAAGSDPLGSPTNITLENVWRHVDAHPGFLISLLLRRYGEELMEWEPETIKITLDKDGVKLSNSVWTKILAAKAAIISPSPWKQWDVFHWTCRGLAGHAPNFVFMEPPELGHLVAGYEFMRGVDSTMETTEQVDKFIAACAKTLGLVYLPPPLEFAQAELEGHRIHCKTCDSLHRDDGDVRCVTCGAADPVRVPYAHAELRDQLQTRFQAMDAKPLGPVLDRLVASKDPVDAATYTLMLHWGYAKEQRSMLRQQLRLLRA